MHISHLNRVADGKAYGDNNINRRKTWESLGDSYQIGLDSSLILLPSPPNPICRKELVDLSHGHEVPPLRVIHAHVVRACYVELCAQLCLWEEQ